MKHNVPLPFPSYQLDADSDYKLHHALSRVVVMAPVHSAFTAAATFLPPHSIPASATFLSKWFHSIHIKTSHSCHYLQAAAPRRHLTFIISDVLVRALYSRIQSAAMITYSDAPVK